MHVTIGHTFSHAILCFDDENFNYFGSVFNQRPRTNTPGSQARNNKIYAAWRET